MITLDDPVLEAKLRKYAKEAGTSMDDALREMLSSELILRLERLLLARRLKAAATAPASRTE